MKIAIILFGDYLKDGRVQRTAEALSHHYHIRVFVTTDKIINYPKEYNGIEIEYIPLLSKILPKHPIAQVIKFFEYFIITSFKIRNFKPDFIHCNDIYTILFGLFFKSSKRRIIYDSHELWADTTHKYNYNAILFKFLAFLEKKTINRFDEIITVGNYIAEILQKKYRINKPKIIMNINSSSKMMNTDIIRKKLNLPRDFRIILYVGNISLGRGLEEIIKSINYWDNKIIFAVLGYGPKELTIKKMINQYNVNDRVFFLDAVPQKEVMEYIIACDAGIIAIQPICKSYYYCLPNKFFQFIQMKKPIVTSFLPEMEEKITKYNLGYTFDPSLPKNIANAVNKLFDSNFQISEKDYRRFLNDYNWDNEEQKLIKIYKDLENKKKNICIIAPVHHYQDIRVYQKEARTLSLNGYSVFLIARNNNEKVENNIHILKLKYRTRIQRFLLFPYILYKAIRIKADFYHLHNPDTIPVGILLKLLGKKVIYDTHEDFKKKIQIRYWIPKILRKNTALAITFLERIAGLVFNAIIVTQEDVKNRINKKALVLANAPIIDGEIIENAYVISKEIMDQSCKRLIYVGGVSNARGLKFMVQSLVTLNTKYTTRLWLIGHFENKLEYNHIKKEKGWKYVDYLGYLPQDKAFAHMLRSDVGLVLLKDVADYSQTSANKIYEYQSFSLPFLASNFKKWEIELKKVNSGLFVDSNNLKEVENKISYLLENNNIAKEMGMNGKLYIQNEFNWEKESLKLLQLYESLS